MIVRRATESDYESFLTLNREVQALHTAAVPHVFKPTIEITAEKYCKDLDNPLVGMYLAEEGSQTQGFISCVIYEYPESAIAFGRQMVYVNWIAVHQKSRGRGAGRMLLDAARAFAKENGIRSIELDSWAFNAGAIAMFQRYGFEIDRYRMSLVFERT
jgi:ribosomal protein S18 acetylase RimI-like enzyme